MVVALFLLVFSKKVMIKLWSKYEGNVNLALKNGIRIRFHKMWTVINALNFNLT